MNVQVSKPFLLKGFLYFKSLIVLLCFVWFTIQSLAQESSHESKEVLSILLENALKHAPEIDLAEEDSALHRITHKKSQFQQYVPNVEIYGSQWLIRQQEQLRPNFRTGLGADEQFTNNNGVLKTLGIHVGFDLQKIFGTEVATAQEQEYFGEIRKKIIRREIVRNVKNYYSRLYILQKEEISKSIQ